MISSLYSQQQFIYKSNGDSLFFSENKNVKYFEFKDADLFAPKSSYTHYWFDPIKGIIAYEFGQTVYIREDFY